MSTFRITTPHTPGLDYHDWMLPMGWRGIGPTERRDATGRAQGKRSGYYPEWFVLMCNNGDCAGRAAIPATLVTGHANASDPEVAR